MRRGKALLTILKNPSDDMLMDVVMAVQNGNWDARMAYYMKLELDRPVPRYMNFVCSRG